MGLLLGVESGYLQERFGECFFTVFYVNHLENFFDGEKEVDGFVQFMEGFALELRVVVDVEEERLFA